MTTDRDLVPLFLSRGETFIDGARWASDRALSDELVLSNVCWGLELVLKAFLLAHGVTDDHNRRVHGHDLLKATVAGQDFGLALDRKASRFLTAVAPYARRHAINEALHRRPNLMKHHQPLWRADDIVQEVKRGCSALATAPDAGSRLHRD